MKKLFTILALCLTAITTMAQTDITEKITLKDWSDYPVTVINDDAMPWTCTNGTDIWTPRLYKEQTCTLTVKVNPTVKSTLCVNLYNGDGMYVYNHDKADVDVYIDDVLTKTVACLVVSATRPTYFFDLDAGEHTVKFVARQTRKDGEWNQVRAIIYGLRKTDHEVVAEVSEPGSLGQEILYDPEIDVLGDVTCLKVSGQLNDADWTTLKNMGATLWKLDLSGVTNKEIPASEFQRNGTTWQFLHEVKLPSGLTTINDNAFYASFITAIDLPSTVDKIGHCAFMESLIEEVTLPENYCKTAYHNNEVGRTFNQVFRYCRALKTVTCNSNYITLLSDSYFEGCLTLTGFTMPESVTKVAQWAMLDTWHNDCGDLRNITHVYRDAFTRSAVTTVNMPNLEYFESNYNAATFYQCQELTSVSLGEKFTNFVMSSSFAECPKLKTVKLHCPTVVGFNSTFSTTYMPNMTLQVPNYLVNNYKVDANWMKFGNIEGFSTEDYEWVHLSKSLTLGARQRMEGRPNVYINPNLIFKIAGESAQNYGTFRLHSQLYDRQYDQIMSTCPNVDVTQSILHVYTRFTSSGYAQWHMISLPFDIKVSDINVPDGSFAIRYYDGEHRAANGTTGNNSWKNYEADDVIPAGTGFIYMSSSNVWSNFPSNGKGNQLFSTLAHTTSLAENPAEKPADKGWNLIGNPYQCYYNAKYMDIEAPITTYSADRYGNAVYTAYSLTDDDYILRPNEGFFVQAPDGVESVTFALAGKQTVSTPITSNAKAVMMSRAAVNRQLVDITVSGDERSDRARVVINDAASMDYELTRDAAKMMGGGLQVYTTDNNGTQYAINERPMADGEVTLGLIVPEDGTYTFALTRCNAKSVTLHDMETGTETDMTAENYTFSAAKGTQQGRFMLTFGDNSATGINVHKSEAVDDYTITDLSGRRFAPNRKGLKSGVYIMKGRKVYVK